MKVKQFLLTALKGAAIGTAVIIPGVSGGTIAVLLNVYDKLINSIAGLKSNFKQSFAFLMPIVIGIICGVAILYFPLKYALQYAPLPTVLLFVGLMIGSLPKLVKDAKGKGFKKLDVISIIVPLVLVIVLCFLKGAGDNDLSESMPLYLYFVLILVGILASCALVVPGISGSMLLMLLGFYQPILDSLSGILTSPAHYILVLFLFLIGVIIGFFTIAKIMQYLLNRFPRTTYWAICGFVIGSIPAILIVFDYATSPINALQIGIGAALCILGAIATYALTLLAEKKTTTSLSSRLER